MLYRLSNKNISIAVASFGAELSSLKCLGADYEYLWQGDPSFWGRRSPVLFPIVGHLNGGEYTYSGKSYALSRHGFARDKEFSLVSSSSNSLVFKLDYDDKSLEVYPFKFSLYISYTIEERSVHVGWKVMNHGSDIMPFSIGAHPAFNWTGSGKFLFNTKTAVKYDLTPSGVQCVGEVDMPSFLDVETSLFSNDAMIYSDIDYVAFVNGDKKVEVSFAGFPYVGLWSVVSGAPFVCIEPWYGIADFVDNDSDIMNKVGIQLLSPNSTFESSYIISI